MLFYFKKLYLFKNLKLVFKNNFVYLKIMFNKQKIYFKLSTKVYCYFSGNFVYFLTFFVYKSIINTLCFVLYDSVFYSLTRFRILFYVNGYNCRVELYKSFLIFFLGYSHPIIYKLPISFFSGFYEDKLTDYEFFIDGTNKKKLFQLIVDLKSLRHKDDIYGGKGVFLVKEIFKARKTKKEIKK